MRWVFFEETESVEQVGSFELSPDSPLLSKFQTKPDRTYHMRIQKTTKIVSSEFMRYDTIRSMDTTFFEKKTNTTIITFNR
jgi:hypothetical protein